MRSGFRRAVILGPPLIIVLTAGSSLSTVPLAIAGSPPVPDPLAACVVSGSRVAAPTAQGTGSWWTQDPNLDGSGVLTGWTLTIGSPRAGTVATTLPPESIVTGPDQGHIVATTNDGTSSSVWIIDSSLRCAQKLPVDGSVARRAILNAGGSDVIAHLLDGATRSDLGIWSLPLDGSTPALLLAPVTSEALRAGGIERVWATDLRLSADGRRLAVQSCDPHSCVTRVLDLVGGATTSIDQAHGPLVGFAGDRLITRDGCAGLPCDILAWDLATQRSSAIEHSAVGAAVSRNGRVVVAVRTADGSVTAIAIDPETGERRSLGAFEPDTVLQDGSGTSGIEAIPSEVGIKRAGNPPATFDIDSPAGIEREARP